MVKYIALLCLHGGVIAISISVFLITPELAMKKNDRMAGVKDILIAITVVLFSFLISLCLSSGKTIGLAVKMGIEDGAPKALGVDMVVKKANLSVCEGYVNVAGVKMMNPPVPDGQDDWKTDHIMKIDLLCVKLAIGKLVCSFGGKFEITTAVMMGVDVSYEKVIGQKSNVDIIVEHIKEHAHKKDLEKPPPPPPPPPPKDDQPKKSLKEKWGETKSKVNRLVEMKPPELVIHEFKIKEVMAKALIQGAPIQVELGDINIDDYMAEKCPGKDSCSAGDVISVVVKIIFNTLLQNRKILGQSAAVAGHLVAEMGHEAKEWMMGAAKELWKELSEGCVADAAKGMVSPRSSRNKEVSPRSTEVSPQGKKEEEVAAAEPESAPADEEKETKGTTE
eukprot:gnl/TRDRNA2_/TRDRNA2_138207_c0_seq1.p1 gnl/TRDRNA2_/TRDRNA2_138207_c0~~gnl/TRDRNA2_/TRDRNA2_138207_c0_seq1.p1  ORF type:complete len:392 (-),score=96.95 gnl/TRDRNA2_/TRDRNA2_138207_c0_seq1:117-1292(-)